ncbi:MAG: hypothetical protein ACM31L_18890 [Actinomycetota bacterium]
MRVLPALALALVLAAQPALAKPKHCLSKGEVRSEQIIRHGVFLREAANACEGTYVSGVRKAWEDFVVRFNDRFKKANDDRIKAFQREFPDNWKRMITSADGQIVTYHRHTPLTKGYCENVDELVKELSGGFNAFTTQAETIQNEVLSDYKNCR